MIRKLRRKVVILSMTSLVALLSVILLIIYLLNYGMVLRDADEILDIISMNRGHFPEPSESEETRPTEEWTPPETDEDGKPIKDREEEEPRDPIELYPELPYESRYFSVVLTEEGTVLSVNTAQISTVSEDTAISYAREILNDGSHRGFIDRFRFLCTEEGEDYRVTFLDWSHKMSIYWDFVLISLLMMVVGCAILFVLVAFLSGRIIRPIAESYEKQKRFITDAGHEMKTPLTVIGANADLLEMEVGASEAIDDIRKETERLTVLTNDLVYLARMEEAERTLQKVELPISELVHEAMEPFSAPARLKGIELKTEIPDMISMRGNPAALLRLVSLLMDNAVKYSPAEGKILVTLSVQSRMVILTVENDTVEEVRRESLPLLFDRFYRADPSRSSNVKGHGIGLSTAKAIVSAHGGKIRAYSESLYRFGVTVSIPQ